MESLRKSKRVALDIIEDAREVMDGEKLVVKVDVEGAVPSTSKDKAKRPTEIVKYDRITFNTTAVLHHYPQIGENEKKASKKSNLSLPLVSENNNGVKDLQVSSRKDKVNNNKNRINEEDRIEIINESLKLAEEKLL